MKRWRRACWLRWRLRRELVEHARCRRQALRAAGAGRWQVWRQRRAARGGALLGECRAAFGLTAPKRAWRRVARLPGVAPAALLTLALGLLFLPAQAPLIRASALGRLPYGPSNRLWLVFPPRQRRAWMGVSWQEFLQMQKRAAPAPIAAFRFEHVTWDGHHGQQPITAVAMTANLPALLGVRAKPLLLSPSFWREQYGGSAAVVGQAIGLDNREVRVEGIVPGSVAWLFPRAQAWTLLPQVGSAAGLGVMAVEEAPPAGWAAAPLASYFLEDLSWARRGWAVVLGLWLLLASVDLVRLVRRQGWNVLGRGLGYWSYALLTVASLGAVMLTLCGYLTGYLGDARGDLATALLMPFGMLLGYALLAVAGLRWCLEDQRFRCRTCLLRLRMPLEQGRMGGVLLAAPATEYLCPHGHGKLLVPTSPDQPQPRLSWRYAGEWWQELILSAGPGCATLRHPRS